MPANLFSTLTASYKEVMARSKRNRGTEVLPETFWPTIADLPHTVNHCYAQTVLTVHIDRSYH